MQNVVMNALVDAYESFKTGLRGKSLVEKSTIINGATAVLESIADNLIPALDHVIDNYDEEINKQKSLDFLKKEVAKIFKEYMKRVPKEHADENISIYYVSREVLIDLVNDQSKIMTTMSNNLQQFIGTDTTTIKDMTIVNFLDCINYVNNAMMDFLLYTTFLAAQDEKDLHKGLRERVNSSTMSLFHNLSKLKKDKVAEFLKDVSKNSTIEMNKVKDVSVDDIESATKDNGEHIKANGLDNFVGNPIYHVRLWIADWKHERFKQNLIKKELILGKITQIRSGSTETYKKQSQVLDKLLVDLAEVEKSIVDYQKSVTD